MTPIALKDILISARQESHRMRHYYLGVEHLLIALLEIKGGLTSSLMEEHGLQPEYVIDAIRRKIGKGGRHRLWAGTPNTPRTEVILDIANEIALEFGRQKIQERDLLIAIIDEKENISTRTLRLLGLDIDALRKEAHSRTISRASQQPFVQIDFANTFNKNQALTKDQLYILRRMFHGYAQIRVERQLTGGYTPALILVVTPINTDKREDASVVVKIGQTDTIIDEAQRYERHVKSTLPPLTARLQDSPTAPESSNLAAIKYTFLTGADQNPHDLRSLASEWGGSKLGKWLAEELYPAFGKTWWKQRRPYRFEVWREYDWLLPPILTLELAKDHKNDDPVQVLRAPIKRTRLDKLKYGDHVAVENFIVQKVDKERSAIQLAIGHGTDSARAYKIEVRGIDFEIETYYRGEIVEKIIGRVWKTRSEQLIHAVRALEPDFDVAAETVPFKEDKLPNPLIAYQKIMNQTVDGSLSKIHGDLHLGNILIGPNEDPLLIDFAHTRDGHTIFDWATLEISLLSDLIMPLMGESWSDTRQVLEILNDINHQKPVNNLNPKLNEAILAISQLRKIVHQCLENTDAWQEYHVALAMCGLRAINWQSMPLGSRRLMFLVSALALQEYQNYLRRPKEINTSSPDTTDFISSDD